MFRLNAALFLRKIPEKDIASVKNGLSLSVQNDMQKWDDLYAAVRIGESTDKDIHRLFGDGITLPFIVTLDNVDWMTGYHSLEKGSLRQAMEESFKKYHSRNLGLLSYGHRFDEGGYSYFFVFVYNARNYFVVDKFKILDKQEALPPGTPCLKPVIYFYPLKEQKVSVRLNYAGHIAVSYPEYDSSINGWNIMAYPDGKIINMSDQEEYSYIFWEGSPMNVQYDMSQGFIVEGEKSKEFLRETLKKMGLKPREYNEFIVYWYPKLKNNKYNLIHFAHEEYEKIAPLEIVPKPDSLLRVFMVYKPLTEKVEVKPQEIKPFVRTGFTVVEWGGTALTQGDMN